MKQNNLLDGITGEHDVIVANILAEVILRFTSQAYDLLKDGFYYFRHYLRKTGSKRSVGKSRLYHHRNSVYGRLGQHHREK